MSRSDGTVPAGLGEFPYVEIQASQLLGRDRAVGASLVDHRDRLLEIAGGRLGQGPRDHVSATAGILPDQQGDGPFRES